MKKTVIAVLMISALLVYWYMSKTGDTSPSTKRTVNMTMGMESDNSNQVEEERQALTKSQAYKEDFYEAQLKEQKNQQRQSEEEGVNTVAYQFNTTFDEEDEYTIVGADEKQPVIEDQMGTIDLTSPIPETESKVVSKKSTATYKKTYRKAKPQAVAQPAVVQNVPERKAATFNSSSFNSTSYNQSNNSDSFEGNVNNQSRNDENLETTPIINAVVFGDHNIRNGEPVRFRIREDVVISGVKIPRNTIFSAPSSFSGRRLQVNIKNIPAPNGANIPTDLIVYDLDHLTGISININTEGQAAKQSGSNASRDILREAASGTLLGNAANTLVNQITNGQIKIDISQGHEVTLRTQ